MSGDTETFGFAVTYLDKNSDKEVIMRGSIRLRMSVIMFVGVALVSSAFAGRNSKESVMIQNTGSEISKEHIAFILELKKSREELSFQQASTLPGSSPAYSTAIHRMIRRNVENISATLDEVKNDGDNIKAAVVSSERGWNDGNVIFYIPNADGYRILSSFEEIERLVHSYVHPGFEAKTLKEVDDLLSEIRKDNRSLRTLHKELIAEEALNNALGILESETRRLGAEERGPILENGWSPKLTHALKDPKILQQIETSNDSAVKWAFEYLNKMNVIRAK